MPKRSAIEQQRYERSRESTRRSNSKVIGYIAGYPIIRAVLHDLSSAYGLTFNELKRRWDSQRGRCAVCRRRMAVYRGAKKRNDVMQVDHCHSTGKVRGLLCADCNSVLSRAKDNPQVLRAGADYLERGGA
jgi:hypothetical protein